jgi:hypothetical protein
VRDTAGDIFSVQALVESDGIVKSLHGFIGLFDESAAPKLCHLKTSVIVFLLALYYRLQKKASTLCDFKEKQASLKEGGKRSLPKEQEALW